MKSPAALNDLKLALRGQLCVECEQRSADGTAAPPAAAQCESDCTLFVNLPRLARVASEGEPPCGYGVFAKSLEAIRGQTRSPDVVHALTILETAIAASPDANCADSGGCKRLARTATALACLPDKPKEKDKDNL